MAIQYARIWLEIDPGSPFIDSQLVQRVADLVEGDRSRLVRGHCRSKSFGGGISTTDAIIDAGIGWWLRSDEDPLNQVGCSPHGAWRTSMHQSIEEDM